MKLVYLCIQLKSLEIMKKWIFYTLFVFVGGNCFAQTPEFEFQLYFEDAAGNKDTVTLGYDALATDSIDAAFGEVNILNQPWGNGLDVRIGNLTYMTMPQAGGPCYNYWPIVWDNPNNSFLTKKQILSNSYCYNNEHRSDTISIQFTTNNLPIKITWDEDIFTDICNRLTAFYGGQLWSSSDLTNGRGLAGLGNIGIRVERELGTDTLNVAYMSKLFPIPTNILGADTIAFLQFVFERSATSSISEVFAESFHLYPNPFNDYLILQNISEQISQNIQVELYTLNGQLILRKTVLDDLMPINTENLERGLYYLKIFHTNSNQFINSFLLIKQ